MFAFQLSKHKNNLTLASPEKYLTILATSILHRVGETLTSGHGMEAKA